MLTEFILWYIHEVLTAYHNPRNEAGGGGRGGNILTEKN